jgi:signal transduction histidine kinase
MLGGPMKHRIASKITSVVLFIIMFIIVTMIISVYYFSKSFYKEQLNDQVENRLLLYSSLLEVGYDKETLGSFLKLEDENDIHFVLFDQFLNPIFTSTETAQHNMDRYREWVIGRNQLNHTPIIEHVETINFHIPHIWAMKKITIHGQLAYLFIDQDTGEFEQTKVRLLMLLLFLGASTFLLGLFLTLYLSKKISKPLIAMGKATTEISQGNFNATLDIQSSDEVGALAEDIQDMAKQLKKYRDSRQQFLSHISHDLRTPLTYIKAYSAVMKDATKVEEQEWRGYIQVIYQEALRMEHLVKDLFELTKLDEGQIQLHVEKVALAPWLKSIVKSRELILEQYSITTKINFMDENLSISIDKERMAQVINNLLENSIRYTKGGHISINVSSDNEYVQIEIQDTGAGIPEEDLPHIWDRFYRVDKSRSTESGGSGLGLSIVKQIVLLHNGDISIKSEYGKGTTFIIKLNLTT